jgi:serralysin
MSLQFAFTEAAHKYGFDNMPVDTNQTFINNSLLGGVTKVTPSWTGENPPIGQTSTITAEFANGFTQIISLRAFSSSSGVITGASYYKSGTNELLVSIATNVSISTSMPDLSNEFLYSGDDSIAGNSFNNKLSGFKGNDVIDGKGGVDTAFYSGFRSQYQITKSAINATVSGADGFDTLYNVERLKFLDKSVALDIDGNAGQAYRLYQAALNRTPDPGGLGAQIGGLDAGMSMVQIAQNFMDSAEFKTKYGVNLSNGNFVTQLYSNVLHRGPDPEGFNAQVHALETGFTRSQLLINFSESIENYNATLVGIKSGIEYIPGA